MCNHAVRRRARLGGDVIENRLHATRAEINTITRAAQVGCTNNALKHFVCLGGRGDLVTSVNAKVRLLTKVAIDTHGLGGLVADDDEVSRARSSGARTVDVTRVNTSIKLDVLLCASVTIHRHRNRLVGVETNKRTSNLSGSRFRDKVDVAGKLNRCVSSEYLTLVQETNSTTAGEHRLVSSVLDGFHCAIKLDLKTVDESTNAGLGLSNCRALDFHATVQVLGRHGQRSVRLLARSRERSVCAKCRRFVTRRANGDDRFLADPVDFLFLEEIERHDFVVQLVLQRSQIELLHDRTKSS